MDLKKCIFVIDSTTTALMVSLIAKGEAVNCIFERKIGIDTDKAYELFMNFSRQCLNIAECEEIIVPSRFFLAEGNVLSRYLAFYYFSKKVRKVFKERSGFTYIGPGTSSIMNCLRCNSKNIYYMYHGTGDYYKYYKEIDKIKKNASINIINNLKLKIKSYLFSRFLRMPNCVWNGFFSLQGFSLVDLHEPMVVWLDYQRFNNENIKESLQQVTQKTQNKKWVMFCPIHDVHSKNGISANVAKYNYNNIEFLKRYISDDENVMIKCHPSIYQMHDNVVNNLSDEIMDKLKTEACDIVEYIPDEIGGAMLPLEILFRYCTFYKIICVESSTLWILKENRDVLKVADLTVANSDRRKILSTIIKCFDQHEFIDDKYIINE